MKNTNTNAQKASKMKAVSGMCFRFFDASHWLEAFSCFWQSWQFSVSTTVVWNYFSFKTDNMTIQICGFTTPPHFSTLLPSSFSFLPCASLSHYLPIWAQFQEFFQPWLFCQRGRFGQWSGGCCHRPAADFTVQHGSAWPGQLAAPVENQRLIMSL